MFRRGRGRLLGGHRLSVFRGLWVWLLAGILMIPSLIWVIRDRSLWGYDQVWYGETTVDLWWSLTHTPWKWIGQVFRALGDKAPGVTWFGQFFVPVGQALGSVELGLRVSILACQLISLVLIYAFTNKVLEGDRLLSTIAMLTMASSPLFIGMSHQYFVEPLQLLGTTWLFWIAAHSCDWSRERIRRHLLGASSLAMIGKVSSPLYGFLPAVMAFRHAMRKPPERGGFFGLPGSRGRALAIGAAVFALFTIAWYIRNLSGVFRHMALSATGEVALHYGKAAPVVQKLWYWLKALSSNLSYRPSLYLFAGVSALVLLKVARKVFKVKWGEKWSTPDLFAGLSALSLATVLLVFSLSVNEEPRFLLALLAPFAFMVAWLLYSSESKFLGWVAVTMLIVQFLLLNGQAHGIMDKDPSVSHWLTRMSPDDTRKREIQAVVEKTSTEETADRYNMCGVDYSWLNAASLKFYASQQRMRTGTRCSYHMLGYAQDNVANALELVKAVKPCFFVSVDKEHQQQPPDFLNQVSGPVLDALEGNGGFERVPHESALGVVILRNVRDAPCGVK